ncbi:zf-HC2 domain-containing protein [Streptomyces tardus]|uniref:zf-HC2 domain-containing protein n=1 Tax=Streptomyces tardus TaxID=2780544 RepID=UPI0027E4C3EE|nr:zf-HC2 domain-containing protein [Streptomyces tardus]
MNDPQEPGRYPGDDDPEQPPLIPPPRAAADDRPPPARPHGIPSPRGGDRSHSDRGRVRGPRGHDALWRERPEPPEEAPGAQERWSASTDSASARLDRPYDRTYDQAYDPAVEEPRELPREFPRERGEREDRHERDERLERGERHERGTAQQDRHTWSDAVPEHPPEPGGIPRPSGSAGGAVVGSAGGTAAGDPATVGRPAEWEHSVLKSLLGAWALSACSTEETQAVEAHLTDCAPCAGEALRLRDAVALLHPEDSLDLNPRLRGRVLEGALDRRPARIPIPAWAEPFDAETARLDALLRDMADDEWRAPVRLRWFEGYRMRVRTVTVAEVIGHLMAVDGLTAGALGMVDPLVEAGIAGEEGRSVGRLGPLGRTEAYWRSSVTQGGPLVRGPWREQTHALVRGASLVDRSLAGRPVQGLDLPLRDAFLDRAFECWVHACDIAEAVDYPHKPPEGGHLHQLVELAARMLPFVLADRRRAGMAAPPKRFSAAGAPNRTLHLEVEGSGGGDWFIPLDSPDGSGSADGAVAHVALDGVEFCQLVAGHVSPLDAAAGAEGDPEAIRDVLFATASMSRL